MRAVPSRFGLDERGVRIGVGKEIAESFHLFLHIDIFYSYK